MTEDYGSSRLTDILSRRPHESLRRIFDAVHDAIFIHDQRGQILAVNDRALHMFSLTRTRALQLNVLDFSATGDMGDDAPYHWRRVLGGEELFFEWSVTQPDNGRVTDVEVHLSPLDLEDERLILAAVRDISHRKHIERELRQTKDQIENLHAAVLELEGVQDEQSVYQLGVDVAERTLDVTMCIIDVYADGMLVPRAVSSGVPEDGYAPMSADEGMSGRTFRTGRTIVVDDIQQYLYADPKDENYRGAICVPIGDFGIFQCVSDRVGAFDRETAGLLEILASHLAAAVRRIRTQGRLEKERAQAEQLAEEYEVIFEGTQDGMFLVDVQNGDFLLGRANAAMQRLVNHPCRTGLPLRAVFDRESWRAMRRHLTRCAESAEPVAVDVAMRAGGQYRHLSVRLSPLTERGSVTQIVGSMRDRTFERETERALQESEEKYRTLVEQANDLILIIQDAEHVYVNAAVRDVLGYEPDELLGTHWLSIVHPDDEERVREISRARLQGEDAPTLFETVLQHADGSRVHVEVNTNLIIYRGRSASLTVLRDVTERREAERLMRYLSFHDQLTDLYNRAYFESELDRLDVPRQLPLSIVMADVNGLKVVNDAFGHQKGDQLLQHIADILQRCCREEDIIARVGGDEFAIILPQTPLSTAEQVAKRVWRHCQEEEWEPLDFSVSLGCSTKEDENEDVWETFSRAEERMYRDKVLSRDSVRNSIIHSLTQQLQEHTFEREQHVARVEELGAEVGRVLELSEDEHRNLALLARLHDVGNVAVPRSILFKEEPLSPEEWEEISRHPEIGYRIALSMVELAPIADSILSHHEWYNGEGYPRGLQGEEIPRLARILSVVDAFDSMTTDRPYRPAMSEEEVLSRIEGAAGQQFDPEVVEALLQVICDKNRVDSC